MPDGTVATTKVCTACGDAKPLEDFHRQKRGGFGRRQPCRACRSVGRRGYSQAHRLEFVDEQNLRGVCRTCGDVPVKLKFRADGAKRYVCRIGYREWDRGYRKSVVRFRAYGLTEEGFHDLLEHQGGGCAICHRDLDPMSQSTHIDHCHATGRLRGILCVSCNTALGLVNDDCSMLRRMIDYLGVS